MAAACVAAVEADLDIAAGRPQQAAQGRLDVGRVVRDVVLHKAHIDLAGRRAGQADLVQALGGVRRGEHQGLELVACAAGRGHLRDAHAHRCGEHALGLDDDELALVDRRLRGRVCGHLGGDGGGQGRDAQAGDIGAAEGTGKLDGKALQAVARDADIARAHADQALKGQAHLVGQGGVAVQRIQAQGGRGALPAKAQAAGLGTAQVQLVAGVAHLGGRGRAAHEHAPVDGQAQVAACQAQAVHAHEGGQVGPGLQAGEMALGLLRVAGQQQRKVHALQVQAQGVGAAAVHARKGIDVLGAQAQGAGSDAAAIGQGQRLVLAFKGKTARELDEVEQVDVQRGRRLQALAGRARLVQRQAGARAGGDGQVLAAPVDDLAAHRIGAVDGHRHVAGRHGQTLDAAEAGRGRLGLQGRPLALRVGQVAGNHQAQLGTGKAQAHGGVGAAVHAHEAAGALQTQGELAHGGVAGIALHAHRAIALRQRHRAFETRKAKEVHGQLARGAQLLALGAGQVQAERAARAGGHGQGLGIGKVQHHAVGIGLVDRHGPRAARARKTLAAHHPGGARPRLGRAPLARAVGHALLRQRQAKGGFFQPQAGGAVGARVQARKGRDAGAAHGQQIHRDLGRLVGNGAHLVGGVQRGAAALDGKGAGGLEEVQHAQLQRAAGAQQRAQAAGHVQGDALAGGHGNGQALGLVVDQAAVAGGLVDLQRQVTTGQGDAVHALQRHLAGAALQAGPLAGRAAGDLLAGHHQGQVQIAQRQALRVGRAALQARKAARALRTQGQQVHLHRVAVVQREAARALVQREVARELHEAKNVQVQVGAGAQQLAGAARHGQRERGAAAGGNAQIGLAGAVVHHPAVGRRPVDAHGRVAHAHRQTVHAHEGGA